MSQDSHTHDQPTPLQRALFALRDMRSRLEAVEQARTEPIAVIGLACRFPGGANDPESFWSLLHNGKNAISEIPASRWDKEVYYDPDPDAIGKMYSRHGGFLDQVDGFDAQFFHISPREAVSMDPQQRILLEVTWEALERAGQLPGELIGSQTGVFVGVSTSDYAQLITQGGVANLDAYYPTGNCLNATAGRVSYTFGLRGPSMAIDAACSSSLVTVHLACQSLRDGDCTLALAAGVNIILSPDGYIALSKAKAMAADGRCKTFDARADGYVRGEGCGVVVLKRLSDAVAHGDTILAVIRGTAVQQDGRSSGLTVPNGQAQQALIRAALANAHVEPAQVSYVEAHGTGTSLGDPIELRALGRVLGEGRTADRPLIIGSVKTNIGHLEAAAGLAGLIKVILSLQHAEIPPHLHFENVNPDIDLDAIPARIPTGPIAWPVGNGPRIAGVSAFGLTGTIAHVVVEEAPAARTGDSQERAVGTSPLLLTLSAQNDAALHALAQAYLDTYASETTARSPSLADAASTAATRRAHHDHRLALVVHDRAELADHLAAFLRDEPRAGLTRGVRTAHGFDKLVFVFPGQGGQWPGMCRDLLATDAVFRATIDRVEQALSPIVDWSLRSVLEADPPHPLLDRIDVIQPALFAIQLALAEVWRGWGVQPDAVVGHSMGEVAAAVVAGALSLEDGARIIATRSRLLLRLSGQGAMAVVELPLEATRDRLRSYERRLAVAASNSPATTVVAGDPAGLDTLLAAWQHEGIFCRRIQVDVASHSPQVEPLCPELRQILERIQPRAGAIPIYSTVAAAVSDGAEYDAAYWARNLREPVLFGPMVQHLIANGHTLFVELSPHPTLTNAVHEGLRHAEAEGLVVASLRREAPGRAALLGSLGALYSHGYTVDWKRVYPACQLVTLPTYPWQRERYWVDTAGKRAALPPARMAASEFACFLGHRMSSPAVREIVFETEFSTALLPFLGDHRIAGEVVIPGACHLTRVLAAAADAFPGEPYVLEDVTFPHALVLPDGGARTMQVILTPEPSGAIGFQVLSFGEKAGEQDLGWALHATGNVHTRQTQLQARAQEPASLEAIQRRCGEELAGPKFYADMWATGYHLGPTFQWIEAIWRRDGEALCRMRAPRSPKEIEGYILYPGLLDSCFQLIAVTAQGGGLAQLLSSDAIYVPIGVRFFRFYAAPEGQLWGHVVVQEREEARKDEVDADIRLLNECGRVIAEVGFRGKLVARDMFLHGTQAAANDSFYRLEWRPEVLPQQQKLPDQDGPEPSGRWLIFADTQGVGQALRDRLEARGAACALVFAGEAKTIEPGSYQIDPTRPEQFRQLLRDAFGSAQPPCRGIVHLWSLDAAPLSATTLNALETAQTLGCHSVLHLVQALAQAGWRDAPHLWLVTSGVQAIGPQVDSVAVAQSPLWGFSRVIVHEQPDLHCTCVDLSAGSRSEEVQQLFEELCVRSQEDQIALRGDTRYVARLVPYLPEEARVETGAEELREPAGERPFRLEIAAPGVLEHLALRETVRRAPGPGEVEVEVRAAGLNFLEVLSALGAYPGQADGPVVLGGECAGTIASIGEGVEGLRIGDEVIALAPHSFGSFAVAPSYFVVPKPAQISFEDAATLPIAYMTSYYALIHQGRLQRGERLLIHSASGGVGLAAVNIARWVGAEVFATAGSPEKRAFLHSLGIQHVIDSRSLAFAEEVLERTEGQGVDVVLNSLTGEAIAKSLASLALHGRFLEIGKRDIYQNSQLGLWPFRKNLSYFAIDLVRMFDERPAFCSSLLREVVQQVAEGVLEPLPHQTFPISEAVSAFRTMAQAKHIGKIVLRLGEPTALIAPAMEQASAFRSNGTYLITGGCGALGLTVAQWMVDQGARHLVLMGRGEPSAEAQQIISVMEQAGAQIVIARADVAQAEQVAGVLADIARTKMPLRGIVHAAGILDDGIVLQLTQERFRAVMAPKIQGAWNLHALTLDAPLDFFVLFSSASAILGSPGQGNYAAGNAFLDALARARHAAGRPGLSINWGPWAEVGLAARPDRGGRLAARGIASITQAQGVAALQRLLRQSAPQVAVMRLDVRQCVQFYPALAATPLLTDLAREQERPRRKHRSAVRDTLLAAEPRQRRALLEAHLREQVAQVLAIAPSRLDLQQPLGNMGLDSLMTLDLRNRLEASLGLSLSATLVWNYPTVAALTDYLAGKIDVSLDGLDVSHASVEDTTDRDKTVAELEQLSDDEAEAALAAKLSLIEEGRLI